MFERSFTPRVVRFVTSMEYVQANITHSKHLEHISSHVVMFCNHPQHPKKTVTNKQQQFLQKVSKDLLSFTFVNLVSNKQLLCSSLKWTHWHTPVYSLKHSHESVVSPWLSLQGCLPSLMVNLFLQDETLRSMQHDQTIEEKGEKERRRN